VAMYLEVEKWQQGYKQILHDCRSKSCSTVLILCAMDTDALCSARIMSYLLRADNVSYQLRPCNSYPKLKSILSDLNSNVVGVILFNLGSMRNLVSNVPQGVTIYVFDCHRPFHLANIYAGKEVVMFLDRGVSEDDVPSDGDGLSGDEDSESESESEDEDEEEEHEWKDGDGDASKDVSGDESQKRKKGTSTQSIRPKRPRKHSVDEQETSTDSESEPEYAKPQLQRGKTNFQESQRSRRDRISTYYSTGTYHTAPCSWIVYQMSTQLRFSNLSDLLWLSCVGLTSSFQQNRISVTGYHVLAQDLKMHVKRLYPGNYSSLMKARYSSQDNTPIQTSENGLILCEPEFPFLLLRHTSLYDAMINSNTISLKFKVWTREGVQLLRELLAKMGFPLEECSQLYPFMKPLLRKKLKDSIEKCAPEYGFEKGELCFDGFTRVTGFQSLISACDLAHAISALLESNTSSSNGINHEQVKEQKNVSFNEAYDALNSSAELSEFINGTRSATKLQKGISLAIALQRNVISTAVNLSEKHAFIALNHFRYAYLHHADGDYNVFCQPLALTKLANFITGMPFRKKLPLVLLAEKESSDYLVLGYTNGDDDDDVVKNRFETYFELAAKTMQDTTVRFDSFLGNAVEVEGKSAQRFIEQLYYVMNAL